MPSDLGCCRSKADVLLLLIHYILMPTLFGGSLCLVHILFCYEVLSALTSFEITLMGKKELVVLL